MTNNSTLFTNFIENLVKNPSPEIQKNFMEISSKIAETIRNICNEEKLIFDLSYDGKNYWSKGKNYEACFVDGGVYSSFISSSAPFAIRAKSYIVKPSKSLLERERFEESIKFMGDLYDSKNNIYDFNLSKNLEENTYFYQRSIEFNYPRRINKNSKFKIFKIEEKILNSCQLIEEGKYIKLVQC